MDRETIEKRANEIPIVRNCIGKVEKAIFIDGARWRINSVWHDCKEELPDRENEWILLEMRIDGGLIYLPVRWINDGKGAKESMIRWAYIADLLPDREEVER